MSPRTRRILIGMGIAAGCFGLATWVVYGGGQHRGPGTVHPTPVPRAMVEARQARQEQALGARPAKQILFGDLHVHTTFSADAFMSSLPLMGGEGAHPPADACDFARFCSGLDFYALTDHAESLTATRWQESKESVRQCNAVAGDPQHPDLVAFMGWEWTQVGRTPAEHYGHKNVIFRDQGDDQLPTRPIAAPGFTEKAFRGAVQAVGVGTILSIPLYDFAHRREYADFLAYHRSTAAVGECAAGVDVHELPEACREFAATPGKLFDKLTQWGFDTLVIPHGTTWGFYSPPGYTYDKQLSAAEDDPDKQRLIEVYSGHGNSEEYRPWRATVTKADGSLACPAPSKGFEPCCHRAGEIIRSRCGSAPAEECERRVQQARQHYVEAGTAGHLTVTGVTAEDWGDCGQCQDCYNPSFMHRPGGSAQRILALGNFDDPDRPRHALLGFIASSDNHTARPGTGYKEMQRRRWTEATGPSNRGWHERIFGLPGEPTPESRAVDFDDMLRFPPPRIVDLERQASFFMTGGLVAVHSNGRSREAIWDALKRREVYGTSGDRLLLWFDLIQDGSVSHPMGAELTLSSTPRFRVRALGSFVQQPGCPDWSAVGLSPRRLERLCQNECYHPGDQRRRITRVEVVRIRPQRHPEERVESLIEDVWKRLECSAEQELCEVEFADPEFAASGRDAIYYVRAIQEPTPAVNADPLRCERDAEGNCSRARPCYGGYRTPFDDDCLTDNEERAWSSPIYVRFAADSARDEEQHHGDE